MYHICSFDICGHRSSGRWCEDIAMAGFALGTAAEGLVENMAIL
jgi:hypothetical protein